MLTRHDRYRREEGLDVYGQKAGRITAHCSGRTRVSRPVLETRTGRATRRAAERER